MAEEPGIGQVVAVLLGPAGREQRLRLDALHPRLLVAVAPGDPPSPIDSLTGPPPEALGLQAEFVLESIAAGVATYRFARWV